MSIHINENLIGVWVAASGDADFMAGLYKEPSGYKIICRSRVYLDDKIFDSKDRKQWYEIQGAGPIEEAKNKLHFMCDILKGESGETFVTLKIPGQSLEDFSRAITAMPCMHAQKVRLQ